MGLFKSKKSIHKSDDNLDIPPPPPMDSPKDESMPANTPFPPPEDDDMFPPPEHTADPFPPPGDDDMFPPPEDFPPPSHDPFPPPQQDIFPPPEHEPPQTEDTGTHLMHDDYTDSFDIPPHTEKPRFEDFAPSRKKTNYSKQLFIEMNKYKGVIKQLNSIKKSLRQSDTELKSVVSDVDTEEKIFSNINAYLSEVEKSLVDLENSLFNQ